jgi:hypothetical protein
VTCLEAAEMRFLRSVKGYTKLDIIRNETIRKELEISGIQDVRSKHRHTWINNLEGMDNTRLPNMPSTTNFEEEESKSGGLSPPDFDLFRRNHSVGNASEASRRCLMR